MPPRLEEIRARQAVIDENLATLRGLETPTEQDQERMDALMDEYDQMEEEAAPLAARAARLDQIRQEFRESMVSGESGSDEDFSGRQNSGPEFMRRVDPFADLNSVRQGMVPPDQVIGRAHKAVELFSKRSDQWSLDDGAAQEITRKMEKLGKKFAMNFARNNILSTGSPEYIAAFTDYVNDPTGYAARAAMSLTSANGGYLVPFTLDPSIILTNNGSANPYRRLANIKTTTTNNWNGVTSAGVSAEWTAENIEAADASPTFGNLQITPQKADAYLFGSFEVEGDSDIASQLPMLLSDAKDRLEEAAFAVGTGTGQPFGSITRATTVAGASGTAASGPTAASVNALITALPARWRGPNSRVAFASNLTAMITLRNTPKFTGSTQSLVDDGNLGTPRDTLGFGTSMLGIPFFESTSIVGAYANGNKVLVLGDWSQYYIVDRVGMSLYYDPLVLGANRRPTGSGAWYAFWRVGADVTTATAFRVLTLTT